MITMVSRHKRNNRKSVTCLLIVLMLFSMMPAGAIAAQSNVAIDSGTAPQYNLAAVPVAGETVAPRAATINIGATRQSAAVVSPAAAAPAYTVIDQDLLQQMKARPDDEMPVIIELKGQPEISKLNILAIEIMAKRSQRGVKALLRSMEAGEIKSHWIINAISTRLSEASIYKVAAHQNVARIRIDEQLKLIEPPVDSPAADYGDYIINVPAIWANGFDGTGIKIAVLDTGIDDTHPDLQGKVVEAKDFTGDGTVDDLQGHGTHVAGIAAGRRNAKANVSGVAPGASLINARVLNREGWTQASWVISGIEWSIEQGADIINMSLGWPQGDGSGKDPLSRAVTNAVSAGHLVVTAAGNFGPGEATIIAPASTHAVLAVAASDYLDAIAELSSRGPTADGRVGIDIAAPGADVIAPNAFWEEIFHGDHTVKSGTSMAAPHVAGAAALLLQAFPTLTPEKLEKAIKNSADNLGYDILEQGTGRLDVKNAYLVLTNGILVEDEWYVGRVSAPSVHTRSFTAINNSEEDVSLEISKNQPVNSQGGLNAIVIDVPQAVFIPAGGTATFAAEIKVLEAARPGTAVGSILVGDITIPVSIVVMQCVTLIKAELWDIVDESAGTWGERGEGDWIYYALNVQAGVDQLNLSLAWSNPVLDDLDLYLFKPGGEPAAKSLEQHPERVAVYFPAVGVWTVAVNAANLVSPPPAVFNLTIETAEGMTIYVPEHHPTIQGAVDAARPGDTIVVREGTYTENIDVTKSVIIKSESGPELTIVQAANQDDHVFHVTADHVTIMGFSISGATGDYRGGIALERANHSELYNNICSNNWVGIGLFMSYSNIVRENTLLDNRYGVGITKDERAARACAAEAAVHSTEITATSEGMLNSLRNLRDRELNPVYVNLFYQYSPEVTRIFTEEPILLLESAGLIWKYLPAIRVMLGEGGDDKELTGEDVRKVVSFISNLIDEINEREESIGTARASAMINLLKEFAHQTKASEGQKFSLAFRNSVYFKGNKETIEPLLGGGNNFIYLNNLINNTANVRLERATATWRSPEPIIYVFNGKPFTGHLGNHWSGYGGSDADGNGIGDTPHAIDNGDMDPYPLMAWFEKYIVQPGLMPPITDAIAVTSLSQTLDEDRIVVLPVKVTGIKDPATGAAVTIPGGLGAYEAKVTSYPVGGIQILEVRGTKYFPKVLFNPATGGIAASQAPAPAQPDNTAVAKLVPRLIGSAEASYTLTVTFQEIGAAETGIGVPEEEPSSLTFRRGDANGDNRVNIDDAMFIAQHVVGNRGLDSVNALNAASVRHDGDGGDRINIIDAMFIAQYVVGVRDAYLNMTD